MSATDRLLDTASIVASAETASGTFGLVDEALRARVDALAAGFRTNAHASTTQRTATRRQIVKLLARRLGIARDVAAHPEILDERIADPVFIIGFPRTGTSIQQALLAADPANRGIEAWRVHEPSPPPGERPVTVERRASAARIVEHFCDQCPGIMTLHPYWDRGAETLLEDDEVMTLDFQNSYPTTLCDAPTLTLLPTTGDQEQSYRFLKLFLQHQQWKLPRKRWVMKGTEHQRHLATLFKIFPDAHCLFPHREPENFLPSALAIAAMVYDGISCGGLDRMTMAAGYVEDFRSRIEAVLSDPAMADPRVRHVRFKTFIADPIAALRSCYDDWRLDWTAEGEAAMRAWLSDPDNDGDRYGRHRYTFEPFGVDWATLSPAFDMYRARFLLD
ncbi:MAG: sulfotransferase [Sphingomonadaceae bacterium]|nr:sulfotransferase [Sphingomonadaceae bacterium]